MKFKATETLNLRSSPNITATVIGKVTQGAIVESDQHSWKKVTLSNGTQGFCTATYLEELPQTKWFYPIRADKFLVTQKFLNPDSTTYPKTGHHPGVDYGTQGEDNVPLYFCADGEVIESGVHNSFGNYFFYYVPDVDRTFVYFHLRDGAPAKKLYAGGVQCGLAGKTGLSHGIHLHLECIKGKKTSAERSTLYTSKATLISASEDPDAFLRARITT